MVEPEFCELILRRLAQTSIGAPSIRNQGSGGLINELHRYLENDIDFELFFKVLPNEQSYKEYLDVQTLFVLTRFDINAQSWGAARKGLNLFFRDIVYSKFFTYYFDIPDEFYEFNHFIRHLEVPLDSTVGKKIRRDSDSQAPRWKSIKSLTPEESDEYQHHALRIAKAEGIARVNLDLKYWREEVPQDLNSLVLVK